MIVLGIDPGISNTGYGVVERRGGALLALDGGVIVTHKDTPLEQRLVAIADRIAALIDQHKPDAMAIESETAFGKNAESAFLVGQANPNNFGVQVITARGDIYIDSSYFGQFELDEKVQVKKRSEFILPATVKVDMISAIKNQRDLYKKKEALVKIQGTAMVKKSGFSKEIPINYEHIRKY